MAIIIKRMKERLVMFEHERDALNAKVEALRLVIEDMEKNPDDWETPAPPRGSAVKDGMERILLEVGKPMHYRQIHEELRRRNIHVAGQNPARNVGAHLSLDPRFKSLGEGKWGLVAWEHKTTLSNGHSGASRELLHAEESQSPLQGQSPGRLHQPA